MKKIILGLAVMLVAGCASVADVKSSDPIYETMSDKLPEVYAACVADKWQERDPRITSMQIPGGMRITLKTFGMNDAVTAILDATNYNGKTSVYVRSKLWSRSVAAPYLDDAKSCI